MADNYYLPIHMPDPDAEVEFSHISLRQPGEVLVEGKLRVTRRQCSFDLTRNAGDATQTTAALYQDGFRAFVDAYAKHPLLASVLRDATSHRGNIRVSFMERHDRVANLIPAPRKNASPHLQLDATWAPQDPPESAVHFAGMVLLATLSMLNPKTTKRTAVHRIFDLHDLLSDLQREQLQQFLRSSRVDCGHVLANAFAQRYDAELARSQDSVDITDLARVPTESLFQAGLQLDKLRYEESGTSLRRSARDKIRGIAPDSSLAAPQSGESPRAYADRAFQGIENTLKWRDKWVTWVLMQDRVDVPYPQDRVIHLLNEEYEDLDEWRADINAMVSRYFDQSAEGGNIHRVSAWAYENDIRLVSGRLSRAFGNQANLLSTAKFLESKDRLVRVARQIERASRNDTDLHAAATSLLHLVQEQKRTPYARLVGALNAFDETLVEHQSESVQKILDEADTASRRLLSRGAIDLARDRMQSANEAADKLFDLSARFRRELDACDKSPAAYVLQLQRLHPSETVNLANANAFREVHTGKEEDLRDLLRQGGDYIYSTPGAGRVQENGQETDTHWILKVNDWVEAIPLFIKERVIRREVQVGGETTEVDQIQTEVDQEAMEGFFRLHAEFWARNIDEVMASERVGLARTLITDAERRLARKVSDLCADDPTLTPDEAARQVLQDEPRLQPAIGRLAALVAASEDALIDPIHRMVEQESVPRRVALRRVLCETHLDDPHNLVGQVLAEADGRTRAAAAVDTVFQAQPAAAQGAADEYDAIALQRTRPVSSLHILTTESAGMTEGYVQSWIEEEMALSNVIRAHGLEQEVSDEISRYRQRMYEIGRKVIGDLGMDVVIEEVMAEQKVPAPVAVNIVISSYRPVSEQVALLGVLLECGDDPQATPDTAPARDLQRVERYLEDHQEELKDAAIPVVAENNGRAFEQRVEEVLDSRPHLTADQARRTVAESEPDYRDEVSSIMLTQARRMVFREMSAEKPELDMEARERAFLRMYSQTLRSTARKAVVARHQLNAECVDPRYYYQATGGNKRYNLLYTPSRVNLGHRERDSVVKWRQWVGGADAAAAQAGFEFYSLVNEGGVEERPALAYAEIQKTSENGLAVTHFAGSNALGLLCNAVLEGDAQDMGDQMNLRGDRYIPPAGEGYGGYCVPKDGLFLAFVLSLTNDVKLRQMGVPDHLHDGVMQLAKQALAHKQDFTTEFDWQQWAADKLLRYEVLQEYISLRGELLVFHITKIARALENLGRPWHETASGPRLIANLAADWSVEKMIINAEQVNRFMVFYKAWSIYDGLRQAREKHAACPLDRQARIGVSAEYKPVQDIRFSTGMRLFEIFAKTGDHLHYAFDEEGQNLVHLMLEGFDPDSDSTVGRRAARQALQSYGLSDTDAEATARLREAFPGHASPADIVMTSVTLSSTNDMLFYTSDSRLDEIANQVQVQLGDYGLTEDQIRANAEVHGGDLRRWAGISRLPEERIQGLIDRVGGSIHALVLKLRGPGRDYETDVQGIDVLNTGIPFPQLLELLQDMPKLVTLMRQGNPNSALVIADGCAGREPRALTDLDVQSFFAACEKIGRQGTYTAIGLGRNIIGRLEEEMHLWRSRGQRLLDAVTTVADAGSRERKKAVEAAQTTYAEIQRMVTDDDEAGKALRQEQKLRRFGKWRPRDAFISQARAKIAAGMPLSRLDAATWIAGLGGNFVLMGETQQNINSLLERFAAGLEKLAAGGEDSGADVTAFTRAEAEDIWAALVRPAYEPDSARFTQQKLVESSSKAVEVAAVEALERRRALRVRAEKARAMSDREAGFQEAMQSTTDATAEQSQAQATEHMEQLLEQVQRFDAGAATVSEDRTRVNHLFGQLIGCTRKTLEALGAEMYDGEELAEYQQSVAQVYTGREIVLEDWKVLAGGYEDIGALARLAERAAGVPEKLDAVTQGMELFYVTFALAQTLQFALEDPAEIDQRLFYKNLTDFFAETINDHWYEYTPWIFDRGTAFDGLGAEQIYELSYRHHAWLYQFIRTVIVRCTDLSSLPDSDVDALLGRIDQENVEPGIGAGGGSVAEQRWRAYNQLRELSFMHSDGFATPPVFHEFDPELIEAERRVNVVFLYPVGRTHVSRTLREGPTLNDKMQAENHSGANLLITRHGHVTQLPPASRDVLAVDDAHLYVSRATYIAALQRHGGMDEAAAEDEARKAQELGMLTSKGIRVAVRFTRPVQVGAMIPFHGLPIYESGQTEDLGLPATVQSLVFSDITYDKSLYPQIFRPEFGVEIPPEMDWRQEFGEGRSEAEVKEFMTKGVPDGDFAGLEVFAAEHPIVLIKGAAESGARNLKVFDLQDQAGHVKTEAVAEAVEFLYDVARRQNVVIQTAILTSPEFWATPAFMESFVQRQVLEWNTPVQRDRLPRSQIYGSLRIVASSPHPDQPYDAAFPIALTSLQVATNVGRGGTLEKLLDEFVQERYRAQIQPGLEAEVPKVMEAMAAFAKRYEEQFRKQRGRDIGEDARGVSYAWPPYLMLDYLVSPVFSRPGRLVDIQPVYDESGRRTGSVPILQDEHGRAPAEITDWQFIHLEPNVGIGLWDRFNLREEVIEQQASEREGRCFDHANVGQSDRVVLGNFVIAGEQYLQAVRS